VFIIDSNPVFKEIKIMKNLLRMALVVLTFTACSATNNTHLAATTPPLVKPITVDDMTFATWNIEHLSFPAELGCKPRSQAQINAMKAYVDRLDADIFALQEVASKQAIQQIFGADKWQIIMSERAPSRTYTCRGSDNLSTQQKVAFAVRQHIPILASKNYTDLAIDREGLRYGLSVTLTTPRGETEILNLHLKSGCFLDNYSREDSQACQVFAKQAPILDAWVEAKERDQQPYIILGDFNHRLSAPYNQLTQELFVNTNGSASSLFNTTADLIGCHPYYPAPIDHILAGGFQSPYVTLHSQTRKFDNMKVDDMLSDHCAVTVSISAQPLPLSPAVKWLTTSKEYQFLTQDIYQQAGSTLEQLSPQKDNWVVIMDVDETILDNSPYQVSLDKTGASYITETWEHWVKQASADLVPGTAAFIQTVLDKGGKLALITNREKEVESYTWQNLRALGLPLTPSNTCLLGRAEADKRAIDGKAMINDKDLRRQQVEMGNAPCYRPQTPSTSMQQWSQSQQILMHVGDNIKDFPSMTQEDADIADVLLQQPRTFILLPNPMYGSW
jgi:predicted secreted acid phosphatase/endonuclease/exonuclease/phosphatase family metal-dependent hydrolase